MHSHIYAMLADAHRDELLRQATSTRLAAPARERRRGAKAKRALGRSPVNV